MRQHVPIEGRHRMTYRPLPRRAARGVARHLDGRVRCKLTGNVATLNGLTRLPGAFLAFDESAPHLVVDGTYDLGFALRDRGGQDYTHIHIAPPGHEVIECHAPMQHDGPQPLAETGLDLRQPPVQNVCYYRRDVRLAHPISSHPTAGIRRGYVPSPESVRLGVVGAILTVSASLPGPVTSKSARPWSLLIVYVPT